jgi:dGTPase
MDWNHLLCRHRLGESAPRKTLDARTEFQRDFDRIIFSSAFRRLQDKTQVFPLARNDYVRTRLTHSLEVSSVGRTLGVMAGDAIIHRYRLHDVYPQDFGAIVAAACIAHDIGNPPFGHAGEDAVRLWFQTSAMAQRILDKLTPAQQQDFLHFEGNAQGFRLLTRLQNADNRGGLQLTCATLGTFSKYPRASCLPAPAPESAAFKKFGFYQDDKSLFSEAAGRLQLQAVMSDVWCRHPLAYLVEAADDICYRIIDIEDGFRLNRLAFDETLALLQPLVQPHDLIRLDHIHNEQAKIEFLRAKAIGTAIEQVHECFMAHEEDILAGDFSAELIDLIPCSEALQALQQRAMDKVYVAPEVLEVGVAGFEVLAGLLQAFVAAVSDIAESGPQASGKSAMLVRLIPQQFTGSLRLPDAGLYRLVLGVTDFVAGMTDSYAVSLYKKITGISLLSSPGD